MIYSTIKAPAGAVQQYNMKVIIITIKLCYFTGVRLHYVLLLPLRTLKFNCLRKKGASGEIPLSHKRKE